MRAIKTSVCAALAAAMLVSLARGATWYVDDDGSGDGASSSTPINSIRAAIALASSSDTICVAGTRN